MLRKIITAVTLIGAGSTSQLVFAQNNASSGGASYIFEPSVSINGTYSNNIDLSQRDPKSDLVTDISPGFRWSSNHGRVKGDVDYSLHQLLYAKNSGKNELQNALNAKGVAELIDNWAFIDVNGSISQQYISAFGTPSLGNSNINNNKTEVSSFEFSPYVRGEFSSFASYEGRYTESLIKNKSSLASDISSSEGLFRLASRELFNRLRWGIDVTRSVVDYDPGRKTTADVFRGNLQYPLGSQIILTAIAGRESDNYITIEQDSRNFSGGGVTWTPSITTKLSASTENHSYGRTHNLTFEHRTPRTGWYFSDNKNISKTPVNQGNTSLGSIYDLFFSQFSSIEPDPVRRSRLVNSFLSNNGIDPTTQILGGYSTSGLNMLRSQSLTFALLGVRDTITFSAVRTESQRLSEGSDIFGEFSNSQRTNQSGITLGYAHKLSPVSVLNASLSQQTSSGDNSFLSTKLRSFGLNYSTRLSNNVTSNLGIRRTVSSGDATSYEESAITGGLNIRF
ncbi:TIGR03016 family PEP-CTERM system-associated outer membrane protein [Variovorax sp. HJSM1_2]|uniref:TIGR03016 family PEP-CTERM system-associated outer membrane protein n=1 Tax=Variovorax sp. HJSM1_2 TaxID=3366263 RepID=UPI003BD935D2